LNDEKGKSNLKGEPTVAYIKKSGKARQGGSLGGAITSGEARRLFARKGADGVNRKIYSKKPIKACSGIQGKRGVRCRKEYRHWGQAGSPARRNLKKKKLIVPKSSPEKKKAVRRGEKREHEGRGDRN